MKTSRRYLTPLQSFLLMAPVWLKIERKAARAMANENHTAITVPAESYLNISFSGEAHDTANAVIDGLAHGYSVEVDGKPYRLDGTKINNEGYTVLELAPCDEDYERICMAPVFFALDGADPVVIHVW